MKNIFELEVGQLTYANGQWDIARMFGQALEHVGEDGRTFLFYDAMTLASFKPGTEHVWCISDNQSEIQSMRMWLTCGAIQERAKYAFFVHVSVNHIVEVQRIK